jgi:hypothetical protein
MSCCKHCKLHRGSDTIRREINKNIETIQTLVTHIENLNTTISGFKDNDPIKEPALKAVDRMREPTSTLIKGTARFFELYYDFEKEVAKNL